MKRLEDYKIMPIFPQQPVSDPQISPDGAKVLFVYTTVNMAEDKYDSHLWLFPLGERRPRQFTHGKCKDTYPRWSPDGRSILFLSNRAGEEEREEEGKKKRKMQVCVIPAEGGEARRITSVEEGVERPSWSPDGKKILFFSKVFKGERVKGSDVKVIRRIKYRFDGRGFFEEKWTHLFSVPSRGGKVRQLTDGEFDVEAASWSPDGKRIALVSNLEEDADLSFFKNIYLIPSRGGEPKLLWKGRGPIQSLEWSPDGRYLAFTGYVIEDPSLVWYKKTDLWVLPVEGGEPKNLTAGFDRTVITYGGLLKWSPDSKYIYFKINDRGSTHICRVSLEGEVERVTEGKMTVGSFSLDGTGSIIAFDATDVMTPSELWIRDEKGMRRVTEMNRGLLRRLRLSEPEEFWFTASDGVKVQGWIVRPHDFKEGEKYPTIFQIHGGPWGAYGYKLMAAEHEFQVLADHGFVVVYTNPRASTGYGESFAAQISGHWGERDYQDIMEAVDYVVKTYPFVDAERLGVAGGSYGGFMVNWIVGHTDRFKAAVTMRSISNWYSFHGTSDIGWMRLPTHELSWGKDPWDNLEVIMEKSPIAHVKNIKTPLLIIHSEQDYRCPIEQAEQLFVALKKLRRVVEFVRFPGESHGLSRMGKPKHRVERLQHILRWFDKYLREG
ncbi:S9 family peptidase [Candidatus Bathyarchaeota archaeon]|nr:MAG: S9 family peptidase [Candidatus Bathyarchaeota archaeon]